MQSETKNNLNLSSRIVLSNIWIMIRSAFILMADYIKNMIYRTSPQIAVAGSPVDPINSLEGTYKSSFKKWIRVTALIIVVVFTPQQISWAIDYDWRSLYKQTSNIYGVQPQVNSMPYANFNKANFEKQIAFNVKNSLESLTKSSVGSIQFNNDVIVELANKAALSKEKIDSIYKALVDSKNNIVTCGAYAIYNLLLAYGKTNPLQDLNANTRQSNANSRELNLRQSALDSRESALNNNNQTTEQKGPSLIDIANTLVLIDLLSDSELSPKFRDNELETSFYSIIKTAEVYGISLRPFHFSTYERDLKSLNKAVSIPFIATIDEPHTVLVKKIDDNGVLMIDNNEEVLISGEEFSNRFREYGLALEVDLSNQGFTLLSEDQARNVVVSRRDDDPSWEVKAAPFISAGLDLATMVGTHYIRTAADAAKAAKTASDTGQAVNGAADTAQAVAAISASGQTVNIIGGIGQTASATSQAVSVVGQAAQVSSKTVMTYQMVRALATPFVAPVITNLLYKATGDEDTSVILGSAVTNGIASAVGAAVTYSPQVTNKSMAGYILTQSRKGAVNAAIRAAAVQSVVHQFDPQQHPALYSIATETVGALFDVGSDLYANRRKAANSGAQTQTGTPNANQSPVAQAVAASTPNGVNAAIYSASTGGSDPSWMTSTDSNGMPSYLNTATDTTPVTTGTPVNLNQSKGTSSLWMSNSNNTPVVPNTGSEPVYTTQPNSSTCVSVGSTSIPVNQVSAIISDINNGSDSQQSIPIFLQQPPSIVSASNGSVPVEPNNQGNGPIFISSDPNHSIDWSSSGVLGAMIKDGAKRPAGTENYVAPSNHKTAAGKAIAWVGRAATNVGNTVANTVTQTVPNAAVNVANVVADGATKVADFATQTYDSVKDLVSPQSASTGTTSTTNSASSSRSSGASSGTSANNNSSAGDVNQYTSSLYGGSESLGIKNNANDVKVPLRPKNESATPTYASNSISKNTSTGGSLDYNQSSSFPKQGGGKAYTGVAPGNEPKEYKYKGMQSSFDDNDGGSSSTVVSNTPAPAPVNISNNNSNKTDIYSDTEKFVNNLIWGNENGITGSTDNTKIPYAPGKEPQKDNPVPGPVSNTSNKISIAQTSSQPSNVSNQISLNNNVTPTTVASAGGVQFTGGKLVKLNTPVPVELNTDPTKSAQWSWKSEGDNNYVQPQSEENKVYMIDPEQKNQSAVTPSGPAFPQYMRYGQKMKVTLDDANNTKVKVNVDVAYYDEAMTTPDVHRINTSKVRSQAISLQDIEIIKDQVSYEFLVNSGKKEVLNMPNGGDGGQTQISYLQGDNKGKLTYDKNNNKVNAQEGTQLSFNALGANSREARSTLPAELLKRFEGKNNGATMDIDGKTIMLQDENGNRYAQTNINANIGGAGVPYRNVYPDENINQVTVSYFNKAGGYWGDKDMAYEVTTTKYEASTTSQKAVVDSKPTIQSGSLFVGQNDLANLNANPAHNSFMRNYASILGGKDNGSDISTLSMYSNGIGQNGQQIQNKNLLMVQSRTGDNSFSGTYYINTNDLNVTTDSNGAISITPQIMRNSSAAGGTVTQQIDYFKMNNGVKQSEFTVNSGMYGVNENQDDNNGLQAVIITPTGNSKLYAEVSDNAGLSIDENLSTSFNGKAIKSDKPNLGGWDINNKVGFDFGKTISEKTILDQLESVKNEVPPNLVLPDMGKDGGTIATVEALSQDIANQKQWVNEGAPKRGSFVLNEDGDQVAILKNSPTITQHSSIKFDNTGAPNPLTGWWTFSTDKDKSASINFKEKIIPEVDNNIGISSNLGIQYAIVKNINSDVNGVHGYATATTAVIEFDKNNPLVWQGLEKTLEDGTKVSLPAEWRVKGADTVETVKQLMENGKISLVNAKDAPNLSGVINRLNTFEKVNGQWQAFTDGYGDLSLGVVTDVSQENIFGNNKYAIELMADFKLPGIHPGTYVSVDPKKYAEAMEAKNAAMPVMSTNVQTGESNVLSIININNPINVGSPEETFTMNGSSWDGSNTAIKVLGLSAGGNHVIGGKVSYLLSGYGLTPYENLGTGSKIEIPKGMPVTTVSPGSKEIKPATGTYTANQYIVTNFETTENTQVSFGKLAFDKDGNIDRAMAVTGGVAIGANTTGTPFADIPLYNPSINKGDIKIINTFYDKEGKFIGRDVAKLDFKDQPVALTTLSSKYDVVLYKDKKDANSNIIGNYVGIIINNLNNGDIKAVGGSAKTTGLVQILESNDLPSNIEEVVPKWQGAMIGERNPMISTSAATNNPVSSPADFTPKEAYSNGVVILNGKLMWGEDDANKFNITDPDATFEGNPLTFHVTAGDWDMARSGDLSMINAKDGTWNVDQQSLFKDVVLKTGLTDLSKYSGSAQEIFDANFKPTDNVTVSPLIRATDENSSFLFTKPNPFVAAPQSEPELINKSGVGLLVQDAIPQESFIIRSKEGSTRLGPDSTVFLTGTTLFKFSSMGGKIERTIGERLLPIATDNGIIPAIKGFQSVRLGAVSKYLEAFNHFKIYASSLAVGKVVEACSANLKNGLLNDEQFSRVFGKALADLPATINANDAEMAKRAIMEAYSAAYKAYAVDKNIDKFSDAVSTAAFKALNKNIPDIVQINYNEIANQAGDGVEKVAYQMLAGSANKLEPVDLTNNKFNRIGMLIKKHLLSQWNGLLKKKVLLWGIDLYQQIKHSHLIRSTPLLLAVIRRIK